MVKSYKTINNVLGLVVGTVASAVFLTAVLCSCDKSKQFDGTIWGSGKMETVSIETYDISTGNIIAVEYNATVTISFEEKKANVVARLSLLKPWVWLPETLTMRGTAAYVCEKDKMKLNVKWNDATMLLIDDGNWSGTTDKSTMTLDNVLRQTVTFTKK